MRLQGEDKTDNVDSKKFVADLDANKVRHPLGAKSVPRLADQLCDRMAK